MMWFNLLWPTTWQLIVIEILSECQRFIHNLMSYQRVLHVQIHCHGVFFALKMSLSLHISISIALGFDCNPISRLHHIIPHRNTVAVQLTPSLMRPRGPTVRWHQLYPEFHCHSKSTDSRLQLPPEIDCHSNSTVTENRMTLEFDYHSKLRPTNVEVPLCYKRQSISVYTRNRLSITFNGFP